ncbi:hypothetical protein D9M68_777730 [compost metagenome]
MRLVQRQEQAKAFAQCLDADQRGQCLAQCGEVPLGDRYLIAVAVATAVIGVVADEVGVEVVEEGVGAIVEGDAEDRHVVAVHHPMTEAVRLPIGDQRGIALDHFAEHRQIRLGLLQARREMAAQHMLAELLQQLVLLGVIKVLEVAETHVALRQAQHHCGAFLFLAPYRRA